MDRVEPHKKWWAKGYMRRLIFLVFLLAVWDAVFRFGFYEGFLMPSPEEVAVTLWRGVTDGSFLVGAAVSLKRIAVGYVISLVAGVTLGCMIGRFKILEDTLGSLILGLQTIPSICWLPFAILWFGLSEAAILFVVVMGALLSITIATDDGVKNTPPLLIQAGKTMGVKGIRLYLWVILPSALPAIVSGMKLGWSFAWRSLMAGGMVFVRAGLGAPPTPRGGLNDSSLGVAGVIVLLLVGVPFFTPVFWGVGKTGR